MYATQFRMVNAREITPLRQLSAQLQLLIKSAPRRSHRRGEAYLLPRERRREWGVGRRPCRRLPTPRRPLPPRRRRQRRHHHLHQPSRKLRPRQPPPRRQRQLLRVPEPNMSAGAVVQCNRHRPPRRSRRAHAAARMALSHPRSVARSALRPTGRGTRRGTPSRRAAAAGCLRPAVTTPRRRPCFRH